MYIVFSNISHWESFILRKIFLLEIQYIIFLQALNSSSESVSGVQLFETPWTEACQAPPVHRILQARVLEWVAIPFSRGSS